MLLVERYELHEVLGEGGFGRTHRATDRSTGDTVVVKELVLRGLPDWKPVEHFEREAQVLAALSHPNIPRFVDSFHVDADDGNRSYYIVSEFIEGHDLSEAIAAGHRWTPEEAQRIFDELIETLSYLHSMSPPVVHRDVKPGNIVMAKDGHPVLVDFGAVKDVLKAPDSAATVLGTPGYMAPEQALGRADHRSDLYGLGITLAHAFTHQAPQELLDERMQLREDLLAVIPETLRGPLARMTQPNPTDRPESASAVREEPTSALALPATPQSAALALREGEQLPAPSGGRKLSPAVQDRVRLAARRPSPSTTKKMNTVVFAAAGLMTVGAVAVTPAFASFAPFIVLGTMGFAFTSMFARAKRGRRLSEHGTLVLGRVTAAKSTQVGSHISYAYTVDGEAFEGEEFSTDALALNKLEVGGPIYVYYDPEEPRSSFGSLTPLEKE